MKYGTTRVDSRDADFSSAMIINAKNSKLDISGLSYLLLAGRTYISSGNTGKDVPMGESISVRANQLAYNVDKTYLNTTDPSNIRFTADNTKILIINYDDCYINEYYYEKYEKNIRNELFAEKFCRVGKKC